MNVVNNDILEPHLFTVFFQAPKIKKGNPELNSPLNSVL
ncbi:hypothetical protein MARINOS108_90064 [Marinoscillum sp. 108]|nr:hypothetical protein MARINOS108_90064 [Marinoscillum sp. 108]